MKQKAKALDLSTKAKSPTKPKAKQQHLQNNGQDFISAQENQYSKSLLLSIQSMTNSSSNSKQQAAFAYKQNLVTPVTQLIKNQNSSLDQANILQNLEANQLLATYLNQLKFPFQNFNVPAQAGGAEDFFKKDTKHSNNTFYKEGQSLDKTSSTKSKQQSQNKDVLDLSLPNRSRQLKDRSSESLLSNFKSSMSSSTISSLSPLSSISNLSESVHNDNKYPVDINYEEEDANRSVDSCDKANTNKKQNYSNKKKRSDTIDRPTVKRAKLETSSNQNALSQENLLTKASSLLSSFSSQQNLLNLLSTMAGNSNNTTNQGNFLPELNTVNHQQQLMNQLSSNTNLFSSLNMIQGMNSFLNQQNKSPLIHHEASILAGLEQSQHNRSSLDQFLQYSNYMKMMENYQKNLIENQSSANSGNASNIFSQAGYNMNSSFSNALLGLTKNAKNNVQKSDTQARQNDSKSNKSGIDKSQQQQPLALVMANSRT